MLLEELPVPPLCPEQRNSIPTIREAADEATHEAVSLFDHLGFAMGTGEARAHVAVAVRPGYCAYDTSAIGPVFETPQPFKTVTGCHDGIGYWRELRGFFGAWSPGGYVRRQYVLIWMPQVGSTVAALAGLQLKNATAPPIQLLK